MNYVSMTCHGAFLVFVIAALTGCSQHTSANGQQQDRPVDAIPSPSTGTDVASQARYAPIKPDMVSAKKFDYKVYEFANDGSWISIVPMPPKDGNIEISIKKSGSYVAKLTNEKCAYPVVIAPTTGDLFTLTAKAPTHAFVADAGLHLVITMDDSAINNYFCNVAVTVAPQ